MPAPDVVILSSIDWNTLWQGPQEIAVRLGRLGRKVLYVENTGVRSLRLSDARRVAARLTRWGRSVAAPSPEVSPNVWLSSPLILPPFGPAPQRAVNRHLLIPRIHRTAQTLGLGDRVLLWTFLPTDTALALIDAFAPWRAGVIYTCGADFSQLTADPQRLDRCERDLVARSDLVFANCSSLARRFRAWHHPRVHVMPNGVSLQAFPATPAAGAAVPPPELRDRPRPIIGYVGGLHVHLALDTVVAMARARPQWTWAYVGPLQTDVAALRALPNAVLTGPRPHDQLASYIHHFDVCTIPYARNVYTDTVVPTKLNEYLAMGKPVVSTNLPALTDTPDLLHEIRTAPPEPSAFLAAIEATLATLPTPADAQRRRGLAAAADWDARLGQMLGLIEAVARD